MKVHFPTFNFKSITNVSKPLHAAWKLRCNWCGFAFCQLLKLSLFENGGIEYPEISFIGEHVKQYNGVYIF
jgi:hypothetical protein